jgi:hypothetical protein
MPGELGKKGLYDYQSDDGNTYCVRLRKACADEGNFSTSASTQPNYPRSWRMRYVLGKAADGTKKKLHVGTADFTLFMAGGTFSVGANTYTVEGREGERRHS